MSTEREVTLIPTTAAAAVLLDAIASLTAIAGFHIRAGEPLNIHDIYFDRPDRSLQQARCALRLRETNSKHQLTFKGPSKPIGQGVLERAEVEGPWAGNVLAAAVEALTAQGIYLAAGKDLFHESAPVWTLQQLGLEKIQERELFRQVRELFVSASPAAPAAEMALDRVVYRLPGRAAVHYEIEIESKSDDFPDAAARAAQALLEAYPLRVWPLSKLATGWGFERLLAALDCRGLVRDGAILPSAYDLLLEEQER
jgi:inorganic triphosphatase YgiF